MGIITQREVEENTLPKEGIEGIIELSPSGAESALDIDPSLIQKRSTAQQRTEIKMRGVVSPYGRRRRRVRHGGHNII